MATSNIVIAISTSGGPAAVNVITNVGNAAGRAASQVDTLKTALAGVSAAAGLRELADLADKYTLLQNRLKAAGESGRGLVEVQDRLMKSANESRTPINTTAELYARLRLATKNLGTSQQDVIDITDTLTKATQLSGTTTAESAGAILQLSQGMAKGRLDGEELRSVLENLPIAAEAIAKQMGVTRGELRELGKQGKITSDVLVEAFRNMRGEVLEKFATTIPTIGQSLVVLQNHAIAFGETLQTASQLASKAILFLADNFETIATASIGLLSGVAVVLALRKAFDLAAASVANLTKAMLANPITAFAVVLAATISLLVTYRNEVMLASDSTATLGDLSVAAASQLGQAWEGVKLAATDLGKWVTGVYNQMTNSAETASKDTESTWVKVLRGTLTVIDSFAAILTGLFVGLAVAVGAVVGELSDSFRRLVEEDEALIEGFKTLDFSRFTELVADDVNHLKDVGKRTWENIKAGFDDAFKTQAGFGLAATLDKSLDSAKQVALARDSGLSAPPEDLTKPGTKTPTSDAEALKKLQEELDRLVKSYDQAGQALHAFDTALDVLDRAEKARLITPARRIELLSLVTQHLQDALDPMAAWDREVEREIGLLGKSNEEREVQKALYEEEQKLQSKGLVLTQANSTAIENRIRLLREVRELTTAKDAARDAALGPAKNFQAQVSAVAALRDSGDPGGLSQGEANRVIVEQNRTLLEDTQEGQRALVDSWQETYDKIATLRHANFISEDTANQLREKADQELSAKRLSGISDFFTNLSALSKVKNRELAIAGRAAAIATATIDGYVAIQKALAAPPGFPFTAPFAASVAVATAANIASIIATPLPNFAFGGELAVGGVGGTDSQTVAFRATPGELVSVRTPSQAREEARSSAADGSSAAGRGLRIINILDRAVLGDYLSTSEGEQVIINIIRRNGGSVRRIVADS